MKENSQQKSKYLPFDIDLKGWFSKIMEFFKKREKDVIFLLPLAILIFLLMVYLFFKVYTNYKNLNNESSKLLNLQNYDINFLKSDQHTKAESKNLSTIKDILQLKTDANQELKNYQNYLWKLQHPYTYFLQYIYLPKLNIWKNLYTQEIDTNMIGINFLENNPYSDVVLVQKWSDFFKNVWENNEYNQIDDISIWDVIENPNWLFRIPITVSFIANSKRSFLLLVDKLSMTSNKNNISLINEFFYNLWIEIKDKKKAEIDSYTNLLKKRSDFEWIFLNDKKEVNVDKIIWYNLYNRIFSNQDTTLINDELIDSVIFKIMICKEVSKDICFYQFRDKYRDLPLLAYGVWKKDEFDKTSMLKSFLSSLPPLMNITQFTFDKVKWQKITKNEEYSKYIWKISLDVYWRWIRDEEIGEIVLKLGQKCFSNQNISLSIDKGLQVINSTIQKISIIDIFDSKKTNDLSELKGIIENIQQNYDKLTNYNKIVKLFEIYRMMKKSNLCEL